MTSTTFKLTPIGKIFLYIGLPLLVMLLAVGCNEAPQRSTKTRIVTVSTPSPEVQQPEPPKPSPDPEEAPAPDRPFYGKSFFDELLTSVYFYPKGSDTIPGAATTHLKFSHREDDLWLCGDQRRSFEPGVRVRLIVTFEPNQECVTNWQVK